MNVKSRYPKFTPKELKETCQFCNKERVACHCFCHVCGRFTDFCICNIDRTKIRRKKGTVKRLNEDLNFRGLKCVTKT